MKQDGDQIAPLLIEKIDLALNLALKYGQAGGTHHMAWRHQRKAWVIDQIVRILAGKQYKQVIANYHRISMLPVWYEGIAPPLALLGETMILDAITTYPKGQTDVTLIAQITLQLIERIDLALNLALKYGQHDGAHHKAWVIDQIVRILADDRYDQIIANYRDGEEGPYTHPWYEGIAP